MRTVCVSPPRSPCLSIAVFQSVLVGEHAEDGGGVQHVATAAGERSDDADTRQSDQRAHRLAQQGITTPRF